MLKEIKYLIFIVIIGLFLFFTGRYYFSDENIIEYVNQTNKKKKKKFNFWKLLEND